MNAVLLLTSTRVRLSVRTKADLMAAGCALGGGGRGVLGDAETDGLDQDCVRTLRR